LFFTCLVLFFCPSFSRFEGTAAAIAKAFCLLDERSAK
jgi:hypothetical protein